MPTRPDHLHLAPGREFTMRQVFLSALAHLLRHWPRFVFILWPLWLAATWATAKWTHIYVYGHGLVTNPGYNFRHFPKALIALAATMMVWQAFAWAVVRSRDTGIVTPRDLLRPLRRPWLWSMLGFVLIFAVAQMAGLILAHWATRQTFWGLKQLFGRPLLDRFYFHDEWELVCIVFQILLKAAPLLATLLVGQIILFSSRPRLATACREQVLILRHQWRRVAFMGLLWLIGLALPLAAYIIFSHYRWEIEGELPLFTPLYSLMQFERPLAWITVTTWTALWYHFVASYFRAVYGLPLTPDARERAATSQSRS